MDNAHYFTQEGFKKFQLRLRQLEDALYTIQAQSAETAEVGGNQYHDNASYENLVIQLRGFDRQVTDAYQILRHAYIVDQPTECFRVAIGTTVTYMINEIEHTSTIVGFGESDIKINKIAYNTPLGKLLIGGVVGDTQEGVIRGREVSITILDISITKE